MTGRPALWLNAAWTSSRTLSRRARWVSVLNENETASPAAVIGTPKKRARVLAGKAGNTVVVQSVVKSASVAAATGGASSIEALVSVTATGRGGADGAGPDGAARV